MPNKPLITVVTVVLNAKDHIENTIQSVVNQTYPYIEYIVLDGGSTDGTLDIIRQYQDKITLWKSEPDKGIFDAMNKGIELANGEWVNFMNAGDFFYSNDVLERIFADKQIDADVIYGGTLVNFNIGKYTCSKKVFASEINKNIWQSPICHQSCFFKVNLMKQNNFNIIDPILGALADLDLFLKFYYQKNIKFYKEDIIIANYLGGGFSSTVVFENPGLSGFILKFNRWKLICRYVSNYKVHFHYVLLLGRTLALMILLKFMPDSWKFKLFKKLYRV